MNERACLNQLACVTTKTTHLPPTSFRKQLRANFSTTRSYSFHSLAHCDSSSNQTRQLHHCSTLHSLNIFNSITAPPDKMQFKKVAVVAAGFVASIRATQSDGKSSTTHPIHLHSASLMTRRQGCHHHVHQLGLQPGHSRRGC